MSYVMVRMYSGRGSQSVNELSQIARRQLAPQLIKVGCKRYTTVEFSNGTVGSTSLYTDKAAADHGAQISSEWARNANAMEGLRLSRTLRGEHLFGFRPDGDPSLDGSFGVMRIYRSSASAQDVQEALEHEALPILQKAEGILRYSCFRTDEGDSFVVLTAHKSRETALELAKLAREAVGTRDSRLQRVFSYPPDVIEAEIFHSTSG
jgi:hypothetical protein